MATSPATLRRLPLDTARRRHTVWLMTNQKRGAAKLFYATKQKRAREAGQKVPDRSGEKPSRRPGREPKSGSAEDASAKQASSPAKPSPRAKGPPGARGIDQCTLAFRELRRAALAYPDTFEDHPWGHTVVKLKNKKVFVFLGDDDGGLSVTCKLPHSGEAALSLLPFASPTGYGLGKSGWVTARFSAGDEVPLPILREWLAESHAAVAPARAANARS
jgi:YjbR